MAKILVYQLWPLSWGSIRTMTTFLPRLAALGVDYVWLSPIYTSPWENHGYDVADYYSVDSRLGTMRDFDDFVSSAHAMGIKVIMDIVIDSTSRICSWFYSDPTRYIWSTGGNPRRDSLLGPFSAWQKDGENNFLALSHPKQATLNWFRGGVINRGLVESYKSIMLFWLYEHGVDGFRIESVQLLNEDISQEKEEFGNLLTGQRSVRVINELSNLYGGKVPFLIMDVIDPHCGKVCDYYATETDVEFITNKVLKSTVVSRAKDPLANLQKRIAHQAKNHKFMLELENHDTPRFTSRSGLDGKEILKFMFSSSKVQAICLYQGQELGLKNPENLSMSDIFRLDSTAEYLHTASGASLESLRQNSCANARTPLPLDEYARQETQPDSTLAYAIALVQKWKHFDQS